MAVSGFVVGSGLRASAKQLAKTQLLTPIQKYITGPAKLRRNLEKPQRYLELGPGPRRIEGFETLNITGGRQVDYVSDAGKNLPFSDASFDVVYASHILEHVAWYNTGEALREWTRVLKPGGTLEVWVPDGLKIAEAFVKAEREGDDSYREDDWWRFNEQRDPCVWMAGRVFSYGDGTGSPGHFNWHLGLFSERYLKALFTAAGLTDVQRMDQSEVRGFDHGWINLGVRGRKPAS